MNPIRVAIVTVSDGVTAGTRADRSGDAIAEWAERTGHRLVGRHAVPDRSERIAETLVQVADAGESDVILTTGGTGLTRTDVTPESTRAVIDREAPGIAEAIRERGARSTPFAWLSRGVAGTRGRTLVVNLPGSEGGVRDGLAVLDTIAPHAVQLLRGIDTDRHDG